MHEHSMIRDLLHKINELAKEQEASKVTRVRIKLGALSHCDTAHFMEHWREEAGGSIAEHAEVECEELSDIEDPQAQHILLESIEIE